MDKELQAKVLKCMADGGDWKALLPEGTIALDDLVVGTITARTIIADTLIIGVGEAEEIKATKRSPGCMWESDYPCPHQWDEAERTRCERPYAECPAELGWVTGKPGLVRTRS